MSTMVRDPWADARQAATEKVLDPDVAAVRRRLRQRWAARLLLACAMIVVVVVGLQVLVGRNLDGVRWLPAGSTGIGLGLSGLGIVLMLVNATRSAYDEHVVTPDDYLDRASRRWLRTTIAEGAPVPPERRAVVLDTARRTADDAGQLLRQAGWVLLMVGLLVMGPNGPLLLLFPALVVWQVVTAAQGQVHARQARRWLTRHA